MLNETNKENLKVAISLLDSAIIQLNQWGLYSTYETEIGKPIKEAISLLKNIK